MIQTADIPMGTYSVAFQTWWRHPFTSKNAYDHRVFQLYEDMDESTLERQIAIFMSESSREAADCHLVKINSIHKLDIQ